MGNKRRQKGKDAVSPTPVRREGRQGLTRILVFLSVAVSLSMMVALIFRNGGSMAMIRSSMLRAPVTNIRGALDEARGRGSGAVSASARALGRGAIGDATRGAPKLFTYEIIREFHHDPSAFTQGLLYYEGKSSMVVLMMGSRRAFSTNRRVCTGRRRSARSMLTRAQCSGKIGRALSRLLSTPRTR